MDGVLAVFNMLGNTIEHLKTELAAKDQELAAFRTRLAQLEALHGEPLAESEKLAAHARAMGNGQ